MKIIWILLIIAVVFADDTPVDRACCNDGEGAGYASRDASTLSMMGWGIGIAAGIATLFGFLDSDTTPSSGGGGDHTHGH